MPTRPARADGGSEIPPSPAGRRPERPTATDHASEYTRDREEIEPLVPDLRR